MPVVKPDGVFAKLFLPVSSATFYNPDGWERVQSWTSFSGQDIDLWTAISGGWNALPLLHKVTLYHLKGGKNQAILHFSLFLLVLKTLIKMAPGATLLPKTSNSSVFIYVGEFLG